jgi:CheY-like chemotaxis protein
MKKVLIVDDDPSIREILTTILKGKYELKEAGSQEEGATVMKEFKPDLVLLDVMMEKRDSGFEMARAFKQDAELQDAKILVITSADKKMELAFEEFAGDPDWLPVDGYIIKPIKPTELLSRVEKLLGS